MDARTLITSLLRRADIRIGGDRPWDIQVRNEALYGRVARYGTLGAGESYVDGWWDCRQLDTLFCKAVKARLEKNMERTLPALLVHVCRPSSICRTWPGRKWWPSGTTIRTTACSAACWGRP